MGAVYDAVHESTHRRAAVKLIRAGVSTQRARERFRIEAETLARLNHPRIAQVYDAGSGEVTYADGTRLHRPFIAMEWVDGLPVIEFASRNKLSADERVSLVSRILQAVHHAHQRGVIHRDLKPGNILVDQVGEPKVVDFGIARLINVSSNETFVTHTGQVLGTIRYMSPEQALGDSSKMDTRSDVYSIGAILYELLAQRPLIDLGTASTLGAAVQLLTKEPARLASVAPNLKGDLDAIVSKAISREADRRYGSAQAFADDLDRYLAGLEVSARAPRTIERFVRVVRNNKPLSAAIAVAAIAVVAGGIVSLREAAIATRHAQLAEQEAVAKSKALSEAQSALDYVSDILASCTPERDGRDARVLDLAIKAAADIELRFKDQPLALAGVRLSLGRTFLSLGRFDDALKQITAAHATRLSLLGPDELLTVEAEVSLDQAALAVGRGAELGRDFDRPVIWLEKHLGPKDRQTLRAKLMLADARSQFDRNAEAYELVRTTYATLKEEYGPEDADTLDAATALGFWLTNRRMEPRAAIELLRPVLDTQVRKSGPRSARVLELLLFLATALNQSGQSDEAVALLKPQLPGYVDVFGEHHPSTVFAMRILASCERDAGQIDAAQETFDRAIAGAVLAYGDRDGRTESTRIRMAEMWFDQGRIDEAEKLVNETLARELEFLHSGSAYSVTLTLQGRILMQRHRYDDALMRFEAAMATLGVEPKLEDRSPAWAEIAQWYGLCLAEMDREADAIRCLEPAVRVLTSRMGDSAPKTLRAKSHLHRIRESLNGEHLNASKQPLVPLIGIDAKADDMIWFHRLGQFAMQQDQPALAMEWLQRAMEFSAKQNGPDAPLTVQVRSEFAAATQLADERAK